MKHLRLLLALLTLFTGGGNLFAQGWTPQVPADGDFYLYNVGTGTYLSCGSEYWGTKACVDNGALKFTLSETNGAYTLYTTSTFSYGDPNSAQLQSSGYVDQSATATTWTFGAVDGLENTYTMLNAAGTYLVAPSDGTKSIVLSSEAPTDAYGYWILINYDNLFPETASEVNPVDITCLIGDANFESTHDTMENFWTITAANNNLKKGTNEGLKPNNVVESWQSSNGFTLSQTITVPNGYYRLTAQTWCREYTVTGADLPYIYLNDVKKEFNLMGTETADLGTVAGFFSNGDNGNYYTTTTDVATVSAKSITLGAKGTRTNTWNVFDNFKLYYLGPIDLSTFATELANAVAAAEATKTTIPDALYDKIAAVITENNKTYDNEEDYSNAITAINNAVSEYATAEIVAAYSNYQTIKAAVLAINNSIDTSAADNLAEAVTNADQTEAIAAVRAALANYLTTAGVENVDLTDALLTNPGFELGNVSGWTNSGAQNAAAQSNSSFDNKQGNYYAERWHADGTVDLNQTVTGLAAGVYEIGAYLYTDTNNGKLYANDVQTSFSTSKWYTVQVAVDADGSIKFGASCTLTSSTWICMDGFKLTYVGGLPDVTAVEGKMNKDVAAAQTAAIEAYNANKNTANYNAAMAAIAAAQASIDAYATAAVAVEKAKAIKEAHNFASEAAATTFAEAIAAIENPYTEETLADADATNAGMTLGTAVSGWHGNNNAAAVVYLRNGFQLGDIAADPALHVNTWSTEGDNDGTGFSVPFYESWTPSANSLAENTFTGSLTGLENGLYKVSAWVRVSAKTGTAATDATGITMDVNGGDAVDVTEGTQVGESQFNIGTYEAEGLVKDGNLYVNFNVAADANISWISFKNIKYTKVRDLTPEEEAIVPTGITLDKTEVTLTATENTVTLTPTFDPENAMATVTWTSSDEAVATVVDGVVTGVAPGTATITVASTLNENVKATCEVTVNYPETEVPASEDIVDGPALTTVTYGENLIKNGTFEYPNSFQGWKSGANGNCDSNNFNIVTDGDNKYIQAKDSKGAGDSHSISTGWAIESGKTYVFGYKVKANTAGNSQYHVVSMTNAIGTETAKVSKDDTPVTTSWTDVKYKFTNTDGYAYVQFRARWLANSTSFDDFYLVEVTSEETVGNVAYATDAIPTENIGTGAFQYSQDAIDAANALVQGTATVEEVEAAYEAVTTLNAPADGQLFNVVLTYGGWTYDNKAMTYIANGRTDGGLYNVQYKEVANQNLAQAFTFTKVEGNNYKMSQIDADGNARYLSTGVPYGGNTAQIRTVTNADDAMVVTVIPTEAEGVYNLRNIAANNYIGSQDAGVYTVNSHINFFIQETTKPEIVINTTAAGWGTTILPFAAEKPADVKVYSVSEMEGTELTLVEVTALEANKPYIIEGAWNETLTGDAQGTALTYTEGLLTGVYASQSAPVGSYVLQKLNGKVAFYLVTEGKQPTMVPNRAYVTAPTTDARMLTIGGEATGISVIDALANGDADIYNAAGIKQNSLQKGMNIIKMNDGTTRKIMVK